MIEGVLRREVGSGQVVVSRADEELHEWILVEGVFQRLSRVREASALHAPVPFVEAKAAAEDVILEIGFVSQLAAHVLIEHGRVRRTDCAHAGIKLCSLSDCRAAGSGKTAVKAADGLTLVAQQLFG